MSHHHTLPPLVTTPESAKAKETRRRRGAGSVWRRRATAESDEADDIDDIPRLAPRSSQPPAETTERHIPPPPGKLSADTLKVMLEAQEATAKDERQS
ncbi:hypothetical protein [Bradyrhizobium sp. STM 3557]|uniref:hypothetical protein n=1 Tax=Bradyrhizobium sp. STM 3557 TaxID=578920 RepID=UPI0038903F11